MARRSRMSRKSSRRAFKRGANRMHPRNKVQNYMMRGGIRL